MLSFLLSMVIRAEFNGNLFNWPFKIAINQDWDYTAPKQDTSIKGLHQIHSVDYDASIYSDSEDEEYD